MRTANFVLALSDSYLVGKPRLHYDHDIYPVKRLCQVAFCPECGTEANVKDYRIRNVFHTPVSSRATLLELSVRRHICPVCKTTFIDEPLISEACPHITTNLYDLIVCELMQKQAVSFISAHLGPSTNIINSVLNSVNITYDYLPQTLCIDEFKADTDQGKMGVCIVDGDSGYLIDVLGNQKSSTIDEFFCDKGYEMRERVKFYCCDMSGQFLSKGRCWFPHAIICVDNFHVAKRVVQAVQEVRRRTQVSIEDGTRRAATKRNWRLFVQRRDTLCDRDKDKLAALLVNEELAQAYRFLQLYYDVRDLPYNAKNKSLLLDWIACAMDSEVAEVSACGKTLFKHRKYIVNAMKHGKSNAYAEGINNSIKVIKRMSYGLPKFEHFRKRCLLCLGPVRVERKGVYLPKVGK